MLRNWDEIKKGEQGCEAGVFGEVPENSPSLLHARKVQRRGRVSGFDFPASQGPLQSVRDELEELTEVVEGEGDGGCDARFHQQAGVLFVDAVARKLKVDPELALRGPRAERFRGRVETAAELAARGRPCLGRIRAPTSPPRLRNVPASPRSSPPQEAVNEPENAAV